MRHCRAAWSGSLLLLLLSFPAAGQETPRTELKVPSGPAPTVDGAVDANEWKLAVQFQVALGKETFGRARVLREKRQLYVAYESELDPRAIGLRLRFIDPVSSFETLVLVSPSNPLKPPLLVYRNAKGDPPGRVSAETCDIRFRIGPASFTFEMRLPLDLLEFGRRRGARLFLAELWDTARNKRLGSYPRLPKAMFAEPVMAHMVPEKDWGADVPLNSPPVPPQPALVLLEALDKERGGAGDPVLHGFMGWRNGRHDDAALKRVQARLERLAAEYPGYIGLRAALLWAHFGRAAPETALEALDAMGRDFPWLQAGSTHHLLRIELLRALGRFGEAIQYLDAHAKRINDPARVRRERLILAYLKESDRIEQAIRAQDKDLPRVRVTTTKGDFVLELFEDDVPNAVANFISLVESGVYEKTRFFWVEGGRRVIGGDPNTRDKDPFNDGFGHPGYYIETEPSRRRHLPFTVSFTDLRTRPRTEACTFDIHLIPLPVNDGRNTVFGRVVEGQDVVRRLAYYDRIEEARVVRKRDHVYEPAKREIR